MKKTPPRWAFLAPFMVLPAVAYAVYLVLIISAAPSLHNFGPQGAIGGDFLQYWAAGHMVAVQGQGSGVYDAPQIQQVMATVSQAPRRMLPLVYPPPSLFLFAPFGALPYLYGFLAFTAVGVVGFLFSVWLVLRDRFMLYAAAGCGLVWLNLLYGQTGLLIAALNGAAFYLLARAPLWGGAVVGLLTIKPHLGLLWPLVLLLEHKWVAFAGVLLAGLVLCALSSLSFGWGIWAQFAGALDIISHSASNHFIALYHQTSLFALLRLHDVAPPLALAAQAGLGVVVVALVALNWRRTAGQPLWQLALFAPAALLLPPYVHNYDLTLLIWPALALLSRPAQGKWVWPERLVLGLVYLYPLFVFFLRPSLGLFVNLLVFLLILRRLHADSPLLPRGTMR